MESELIRHQEAFNHFKTELGQQKMKVVKEISTLNGNNMDALSKEIDNLTLTVLNSRKEIEENKYKISVQQDQTMKSSIEEYLIEEEKLEALESSVLEKEMKP